ncbi:MAG: DUF2520 domain-containing protein [Bifidobacteriaceae bacterium]|jgi:predicted short-subunit dehydrogenase-like oxidoreductase (DUF2520 family)|nr:DUF2520 domain-containing protein [Bifidobacteriaceae bacterium]
MANDMLPAGIIGFGRVGAALAGALTQVAHPVVEVAARSAASRERAEVVLPGVPVTSPTSVAERAALVFVTVPDAAIRPVVEQLAHLWRPGQIVVHAAGVAGADVLEPVTRVGGIGLAIHPAMTFSGTSLDVARLRGVPFAIDAPAGFAPLAEALAVELGGIPFAVGPAARAAYHAALSHGANHLVTLIAQAVDLLAAHGIDDPAGVLGPLTRVALDNALSGGFAALTGPAARGDAATLAAHVEALAKWAARRGAVVGGAAGGVALDDDAAAALATIAAYRQMAKATLAGARAAGRISAAQTAECTVALGDDPQ